MLRLVLVPLVGLTLIVSGVVLLEHVAPQVDITDRRVPGVPPLANEEARHCQRPDLDGIAEEIRAEFVPGSRVSSTQVFRCPSAYDLLEVSYAGEVIGELIRRDGGVWVQVNDDAYALEVGPVIGHRERAGFNTGLAVWLPDGTHEDITGVGRPGVRGDVLLIRGRLHRTDPADGGGLTLRAAETETLAASVTIPKPFHAVQAIVAGVLAVGALGSIVWARRVRQR